MSLLEDVFLEDEAGEAQELERIIEGDEYDERPAPDSDDNSEKEDEAEEDKRHVDPTSAKPKRIVKNPRVILNPARLTGPRGIQIIPEHFKDFKFKGKGHEKEDIDLVLKKLEHWAYRLYPKFEFKDCLKKIETLGNKRPVMVHLTKIRTDQYISEETVVQKDSSDDEVPAAPQAPEEDEFDRLLQQQIELARTTPGPGSARKGPPGLATPVADRSLMMPKATSSPSISEEQKQRMLRNRQLAEERRLARLKLNQSGNNSTNVLENSSYGKPKDNVGNNVSTNNNISPVKDTLNTQNVERTSNDTDMENSTRVIEDTEENIAKAKSNRLNVIDSSDSDDDGLVINEAVRIDVHNTGCDDVYLKENGNENVDNVQDINNSNVKLSNNSEEIDTEEISDIPAKKSTKEDIETDIHVEINENEIGNEKDSTTNISNKSEDIDQITKVCKQTDNAALNITKVGIEPETIGIDSEPTISENCDKNVSETEEITKIVDSEKGKEAKIDDIMDVDFSDEF